MANSNERKGRETTVGPAALKSAGSVGGEIKSRLDLEDGILLGVYVYMIAGDLRPGDRVRIEKVQ